MLYKFLKKIYNFFFYLITPWHLIAVFFFLILNRKLLKNNIIFPFFTWSFGHQTVAYDIASRINYPKKISLIEINHPRNNEYLSECYTNLEKYKFDTIFFLIKKDSKTEKFYYLSLIYLALNIINFFKFKKNTLLEHLKLYEKYKLNKIPLNQYDNFSDKIINYNSLTAFTNIIKSNIGRKPDLPIKYKKQILKKLNTTYKNFSQKKTYIILFRKKRTDEYYDKIRDGGNETKYIKLINKLKKNKSNVILTGDFSHNFINKYKCIDLKDKKLFGEIPHKVLNLFFLMYGDYLITQHSGAMCLVNSHGKTVTIIVDSFPFYIGTHCSKDRVLMKNVIYKKKILKIKDIYEKKNHRLLRLGKVDKKKGYSLEENSDKQIYNAVFKPKFLKTKFDNDLMIHYTKTKILDL
jgi:putative glycosyltransferase (TIGR04372 family)